MEVKCFPEFYELFYQIIEPEEEVMGPLGLQLVSHKCRWHRDFRLVSEVRVVLWD